MGKLLTIGLAAVILFSASAGISWYLRHLQETKAEHDGEKTTETEPPFPKRSTPAAPTAPPLHEPPGHAAPSPSLQTAVRPPYNPEAEGAVQIASSLKERLDAVHAREEQLSSRQKNLELIFQDIRAERTTLDDKRRQVANLMKAVEDKMTELDRKVADLEQKRQEADKETKQLKRNISEYQTQERERIKQESSMFDTMEPASAARILQSLADTGQLDTSVKILATMRERQAAKVLAELGDPSLAAQLLDKLKGLKKPTATAPK